MKRKILSLSKYFLVLTLLSTLVIVLFATNELKVSASTDLNTNCNSAVLIEKNTNKIEKFLKKLFFQAV